MARINRAAQAATTVNDETFGKRLARLRKEKGYTQVEMAEKVGIIQVLISDYERDKLRPHYEMIRRFAQVLEVSADEILGIKVSKHKQDEPSLKVLRRIKKIEALPVAQQKILLRTIDTLLKGVQK